MHSSIKNVYILKNYTEATNNEAVFVPLLYVYLNFIILKNIQ